MQEVIETSPDFSINIYETDFERSDESHIKRISHEVFDKIADDPEAKLGLLFEGMPVSSTAEILSESMAETMQLLSQMGISLRDAYEYSVYTHQNEGKRQGVISIEEFITTDWDEDTGTTIYEVTEKHNKSYSRWLSKFRKKKSNESDFRYNLICEIERLIEEDTLPEDQVLQRVFLTPEGISPEEIQAHQTNRNRIFGTIVRVAGKDNKRASLADKRHYQPGTIFRDHVISESKIRTTRTERIIDKLKKTKDTKRTNIQTMIVTSPVMSRRLRERIGGEINYNVNTEGEEDILLDPLSGMIDQISSIEGLPDLEGDELITYIENTIVPDKTDPHQFWKEKVIATSLYAVHYTRLIKTLANPELIQRIFPEDFPPFSQAEFDNNMVNFTDHVHTIKRTEYIMKYLDENRLIGDLIAQASNKMIFLDALDKVLRKSIS